MRGRLKLGRTTLRVIDIDDLIHVKTLAGHPQDRVDVKMLKKVQRLALAKNSSGLFCRKVELPAGFAGI
jgi:hypothetical protein